MRRYYEPVAAQDVVEQKQVYREAYGKLITQLTSHGLTEVERIVQTSKKIDSDGSGQVAGEWGYHEFIWPPQPGGSVSEGGFNGEDDYYNEETGIRRVTRQESIPFSPSLVEQYVTVRYVSEDLAVSVDFVDGPAAKGRGDENAPIYPAYAAVGEVFDEPSLAHAS